MIQHHPRATACLTLALLAGLAACRDGTGPPAPPSVFDRYVALGNSVTAGFESDGINDSTQAAAYPSVLAARFGARFHFAALLRPGCPPPLTGPAPLTDQRVGGAPAFSCAGFATPLPPFVGNVALPGARIADALTVPGGPTGLLYQQVFGPRSPLEVLVASDPTLVSIWLGNGDVLTAALDANPAALTALAAFQASLDAIVDAVAGETAAEDVILIGVSDPTTVPLLQPGAYFWAAANMDAGGYPLPRPVSDDCAPAAVEGGSDDAATHLVSFRAFRDPAVSEVSCAAGAPYVLDAALYALVRERVAAFNAVVEDRAARRGWLYLDPNAIMAPYLDDPGRIRNCHGILDGGTIEALLAAVASACPHVGAPDFFGSLFSHDGFHPSSEAQALLAEAIAAALRARHPMLPGVAGARVAPAAMTWATGRILERGAYFH